MGIKAHYLTDKNGIKFYPYAHADATFDKNGNKVGDRLDDIENNISDITADINEHIKNENIHITTEEKKKYDNYQNELDSKVPTTRTVNGKALSTDIVISASDVGADASGSADSALSDAKEYADSVVATETSRAKSAESTLTTSLNSEISRAKSVEATKVDSVKIGTTEYKSGTTVTLPVYTIDEADSTFGADISLSIDTSTYKMTLLLKDNNGNTLSTQTIDFPIESMVVNANYASGILTLTLQNGNMLPIDISSIISGLVPDTRTIAGVDLKDNITAAELRTALNVSSGAQVNQNAFSNVVVGSTTIAADSTTDTLTLVAGSNITLTPDATNDNVTIAATDTVYTHPSYTARTGVPTANQTPVFGGTFNVSQPVSDATGHITAINNRTVTIPSTEVSTSVAGLMSASDKTKLDGTNVAYGTCSTEASTVEKIVTISGNTKWILSAGSMIAVKYTYTNTASNPTLNVNGTGAKSIWYNTGLITTSNLSYAGYASRISNYIYDGSQYVFIGWSVDSNTTYSNASLGQGYGTCTTAATTTAKVVTLSSYSLITGGIVAVKFTYAVPASATLNINSKGAKSIYHRGSAIAAGIIESGDIGVFIYNGSQYHLLTVDRDEDTTIASSIDTDGDFDFGDIDE